MAEKNKDQVANSEIDMLSVTEGLEAVRGDVKEEY